MYFPDRGVYTPYSPCMSTPLDTVDVLHVHSVLIFSISASCVVVVQRVNMQRVFPSLCKECTNDNMVPFLLPNMLLIAEKASDADFSKHIFPAFIPLFRITDPVQVSWRDSGIGEICRLIYTERGSHASWKVLDFFLENSRTWKVLENHFGPGKSWKLRLRVLEKYP